MLRAVKQKAESQVDSPAYSLCLYTFRGYCRSARRSPVLHELLYTGTQEGRVVVGLESERIAVIIQGHEVDIGTYQTFAFFQLQQQETNANANKINHR